MATCALFREESRGGHFRTDFPEPDDCPFPRAHAAHDRGPPPDPRGRGGGRGMNEPVLLFPFGEYWWFYAAFLALVLGLLSLDLGVFHRRAHAVSFKEAATWTVVWMALALAFLGGFYLFMLHRLPLDPRLTAIPGFDPAAAAHRAAPGVPHRLRRSKTRCPSTTSSCSCWSSRLLRVPAQCQHRVLFFGILGALVLRGPHHRRRRRCSRASSGSSTSSARSSSSPASSMMFESRTRSSTRRATRMS